MGITQLNSYLNKMCKNNNACMSTISLSSLKNKKMVVDIQMYLYGFLCNERTTLMNEVYRMCAIFSQCEILPLFVFDNRNQNQCSNKLCRRRLRKKQRNKAMEQLGKYLMDTSSTDGCDAAETENPITMIKPSKHEIKMLKRQIVRLTDVQIKQVKNIILSFGFTWVDAKEEADEVCAYAALTMKSCGCLSDDTDMIAYGCPNIYRNLNLDDQTVNWINLPNVLKQLGMTQYELRQICALASNDYNCDVMDAPSISQLMEHFCKYKNDTASQETYENFYEWFLQMNRNKNTTHVDDKNDLDDKNNVDDKNDVDNKDKPENVECDLDTRFKQIYDMFDIYARPDTKIKLTFERKNVNKPVLKSLMEQEGFYYI